MYDVCMFARCAEVRESTEFHLAILLLLHDEVKRAALEPNSGVLQWVQGQNR